MIAFLSILLAVVLLGITVYGLHRYQTMEVEYTVDRSTPLPPLDGDKGESDRRAFDPAVNGDSPGKQAVDRRHASATRNPKSTQTWLNRVAELKKTGDMAAAISICESEFPLWGAYNQACIIERLKIKEEGTSKEELEAALQRLYRLAVTAELLHDKSDDHEHLTLNQLKTLDLASVDALEHSYAQIGYAHLRLIRKSDIKVMLANWGRPEQHTLPRSHHEQWWQEFVRKLA